MSEDQEKHLQSIKDQFKELVDPKYRKGQAEHGPGSIWELSETVLLDSAIDEAIDQVVYLLTLRDKLKP